MFKTPKTGITLCLREIFTYKLTLVPLKKDRNLELGFEKELRLLTGEGRGVFKKYIEHMERQNSMRWSVLIGECHIETEVTESMGRMEGGEAGVGSLVQRAQSLESHANLANGHCLSSRSKKNTRCINCQSSALRISLIHVFRGHHLSTY